MGRSLRKATIMAAGSQPARLSPFCASLLTAKQDSGSMSANCVKQRADSGGGMHCQQNDAPEASSRRAPVQSRTIQLGMDGGESPVDASRFFRCRVLFPQCDACVAYKFGSANGVFFTRGEKFDNWMTHGQREKKQGECRWCRFVTDALVDDNNRRRLPDEGHQLFFANWGVIDEPA